jgi:Amt family ammonium transporter
MCDAWDSDTQAELALALTKISNTVATVASPQATETAAWLCDKVAAPLSEVTAKADQNASSLDGAYMLVSAFLVFFMQAGFAMLCAGSVRNKNTMNILLKNVLDACVGAIGWWLFGWSFAYGGDTHNDFIGAGMFATHNIIEDGESWHGYLFQWAFAAAAATIVSGSVAERTQFMAYLSYSFFLTSFVYPVVVHWVWSGDGWLNAFKDDPADLLFDSGMLDFAGSGVVHMVGGFAGLCGAAVVGPRMGRFSQDGKVNSMPGHSATLVVLGTFILWVGWYGFNPGSQLAVSDADSIMITGRVAVTTTLGAGSAGFCALFLTYLETGMWDLLAVCNGALAGLVSITAPCPVVEPWAALLIGGIGALVFNLAGKLLRKLKIDDPLEAAPMHGFCGAWGVFANGLLAKKEFVRQAYGREAGSDYDCGGLFYGGDNAGKLLGAQIVGIISIAAWTCGLMFPFFFIFHKMGLMRVPEEEEVVGLDQSHHGGSAYNYENQDNLKSAHPKV